MKEPSLAEAGCLGYQPYVNPSDPTHILIVEEWTNKAALDAHFASPHFQRLAPQLESLLTEPAKITFLSAAAQG